MQTICTDSNPVTGVASPSDKTRKFRPELVEAGCFSVVATAYFVYFRIWGDNRFYFDARRYWSLADRFQTEGHFSLLSYDNPIRGYSLPLLNDFLKAISSWLDIGSVTIIEFFGALLAATLAVILLPRLAKALFSNADTHWTRILLLNALVFLFWRGHLNYPLSDFPAAVAAVAGLLGLLRRTAAGYLVAGIGIGLATNIRPAYFPALVVALVAAAAVPLKPWRLPTRSAFVGLILLGALIASAPQMLINHRHSGTWSPFVSGTSDLTHARLTGGLLIQRTETYVGPPTQYPRPLVNYLDPFGIKVRNAEHVSKITSDGQYLRIALRHPVFMTLSYALHTFNGFDVRYPTPYVKDLRDRPVFLPAVDYTIIFLAIIRLVLSEARRRLGRIRWIGIVLLLSPTVVAISSALEPRYFLTVHLLMYMLVCFSPGWRSLFLAGTSRRRVGIAAAYVALLMVSFTLRASVSAQIEYPITAGGSGSTLH